LSVLQSITDLVLDLIDSMGYLGIFLCMLVEGIITPIPSEAIMPLAGYLSSQGRFNVALVILIATAGAVIGSTIAYMLAKHVGRAVVLRWGRVIGITDETLEDADKWFEKYGQWGVFLGHSVPGVRSIISFPAGLAKMDLKRFMISTAGGALVWNSVLTLTGYWLGEPILDFWKQLGESGLDYVIVAVVVVVVVAYLLMKRRERSRGREEAAAAAEESD